MFPFLTFLGPALGLATSLAGTRTGQGTAMHYITQIGSLLSQGLQVGLDIDLELKAMLGEMQTLVSEQRAATADEMQASNDRLRVKINAALAHDTSGHPSLKQG